MLYIIYDRDFRTNNDKEAEWHVGEDLPNIKPHRIVELQADGDERAHIEKIMGGGVTGGECAYYYGDFARTIFLNL